MSSEVSHRKEHSDWHPRCLKSQNKAENIRESDLPVIMFPCFSFPKQDFRVSDKGPPAGCQIEPHCFVCMPCA